MIANYGYKDGSGDFFISIDTDKCNGCGDCVDQCPADVFEMVENEFDIEDDDELAAVKPDQSRKLKYACGPCKPAAGFDKSELPCVRACEPDAIDHSW